MGPNTSSCLSCTPSAAKLAHPLNCFVGFVVDSFFMMILLSQISHSSIGMLHHRSFGKSFLLGSMLPLVWTKFRYLDQSTSSFGGVVSVCMTTQYCSVFSHNPRSCSAVASGASISKRT